MDIIIVREQTEGEYTSLEHEVKLLPHLLLLRVKQELSVS